MAAARGMIHEDTFSMRALAERSSVSVVTAYSLCGSRQDIISTMYAEDLVVFEKELEALNVDAIERMFAALQLAAQRFGEDPAFHKAMFRAIYGSSDSALSDGFFAPRVRSWEKLVAEASATGLLDDDVNANAVAKNVIHMLLGSIIDWVRNNISLEQMHAEVGYGLSLILIPLAAKKAVPDLYARFATHDSILRRIAKTLP